MDKENLVLRRNYALLVQSAGIAIIMWSLAPMAYIWIARDAAGSHGLAIVITTGLVLVGLGCALHFAEEWNMPTGKFVRHLHRWANVVMALAFVVSMAGVSVAIAAHV